MTTTILATMKLNDASVRARVEAQPPRVGSCVPSCAAEPVARIDPRETWRVLPLIGERGRRM